MPGIVIYLSYTGNMISGYTNKLKPAIALLTLLLPGIILAKSSPQNFCPNQNSNTPIKMTISNTCGFNHKYLGYNVNSIGGGESLTPPGTNILSEFNSDHSITIQATAGSQVRAGVHAGRYCADKCDKHNSPGCYLDCLPDTRAKLAGEWTCPKAGGILQVNCRE